MAALFAMLIENPQNTTKKIMADSACGFSNYTERSFILCYLVKIERKVKLESYFCKFKKTQNEMITLLTLS